MVSRRALLIGSGLIPFGLAACANPQQAAQTVGEVIIALVNGVENLVQNIQATTGIISAATMANIKEWADAAKAAATGITQSTQTVATSTIQEIEGLINDVLTALNGVTFPIPIINTIVAALTIALPLLESITNIFLPSNLAKRYAVVTAAQAEWAITFLTSLPPV